MRRWSEGAARVRRYAGPRAQRSARRLATRYSAIAFAWVQRLRGRRSGVSVGVRVQMRLTSISIGERPAALAEPERRPISVGRHHTTLLHLATQRVREGRAFRAGQGAPGRAGVTPLVIAPRMVAPRAGADGRDGRSVHALIHTQTTRLAVSERRCVAAGRAIRATSLRVERETTMRVVRERTVHAARAEWREPAACGAAGRPVVTGRAAAGRADARREVMRTAALPMRVARAPVSAAAPARPFTPEARPLTMAGASTASVAEAFPVERIERTIKETMRAVVERTVRREVDRVVQPGAAQGRRLRETIQSELYDEIVLERERLGER